LTRPRRTFNERELGEAVARSGIERRELFITTKLWMSDYGYDRALRAFDISLRKLGLEYLDLYLLHWPVPSAFETTVPSYLAAEKLLADGRVRAIGVSNFSAPHLEDLIARTSVVPAVNQIELHPFFIQQELRDMNCQCRPVAVVGWRRFHRRPCPGRRRRSDGAVSVLIRTHAMCA
jgi:diketogulonate reductase-like aldo/keto reductase